MLRTIAFCTLGCKVNQYETDVMKEMFEKRGYAIREFHEPADIYVINTCSVTNMADRKSRQMLHRAKKKNPNSVIAAVGCYVQAAKEELEKDNLIDIVIGNNKKSEIVDITEAYLLAQKKEKSIHVIDISKEHEYEKLSLSSGSEHTRAYIKIQDGCNQFCSYCIIPYTRGRIRSRGIDDICQEIDGLVKAGYKEVVLTGIHISSYGLDFVHTNEKSEEDYGAFKHSALLDLIEKIADIDGLERIRFGSLEPRIITEKFLGRLAQIKQVCPHFHLSLQSGCDQTLKRMNRHYTAEEYLNKCQMIRRYFDRPSFTTDVIVGFPGETDEEFMETEKFLEKVSFMDMHVFKYSKRHGTKAAVMPDQVCPEMAAVRSEKLIHLGAQMHDQYIELCHDQIQEVLLEELVEIDGHVYITGHSKNFIRCLFEPEGLSVNTIIKGKIEKKINQEFVFCKRID